LVVIALIGLIVRSEPYLARWADIASVKGPIMRKITKVAFGHRNLNVMMPPLHSDAFEFCGAAASQSGKFWAKGNW
jgi:hypothetical protein